jgi:hypothetical protein
MAAGRRYGKSITADNRVIDKAISNPGWRCMYLTPTYAQLIERFASLAENEVFARQIAYTKLQPFPQIVLKNGSKIYYRTFERPKNIRGSFFNEVIVDESQDIKEDQFWPVIRPLVADLNGNIILLGQFRGYDWRYEKFFLPGQPDWVPPANWDGRKSDYKSFVFPSHEGIRFLSEKGKRELADMEAQMPRRQFDQECRCIPVANQAAVFDPSDLEAMKIWPTGLPVEAVPEYQQGQSNILGLDLGRIVDPSAIVVLNSANLQVIHAEKLPLGMKHEVQAGQVKKIANRYRARVVFDCTGGATGGNEKTDAYLQFYRNAIPDIKSFYWQQQNKERIIQHLELKAQLKQVKIPARFSDLYKELTAYEFEYNANNGTYKYHAPLGQTLIHDDYVAALAMAVWGAHCGWGPMLNGSPLATLMG